MQVAVLGEIKSPARRDHVAVHRGEEAHQVVVVRARMPEIEGERPAVEGVGHQEIVGAVLLVGAALWYLFRRTWLGRAMRASSENPRAALLMGISPKNMSTVAFAMAGAMGGLAGALIAPIASANYDSGLFFGLKGFSAAVLGGLGSPVGAVLGGLLLGLIESFTAGYLSSSYKDALALTLLILMLLLRPSGLLGSKEVKRV